MSRLTLLSTSVLRKLKLGKSYRCVSGRCVSGCLLAIFLSIPGSGQAASNESDSPASIDNILLGLPAQQIAKAYGDQKTYTITRNGKRIGTHTISFKVNDNELTVAVESSLTVRVLRIAVYRLSYSATELWRDNQLVTATATTTENGKANTVSLDNENTNNGDIVTHFASNHWHPGVLTGDTVFNTLTGETSQVSVIDLGLEQVETASGTESANHYQYEDDIKANVWYDESGLWLMMQFKADDGSVIRYLRDD